MSGKEILVTLIAGLGFAGYGNSPKLASVAAQPVQAERTRHEAPAADAARANAWYIGGSSPALAGPF